MGQGTITIRRCTLKELRRNQICWLYVLDQIQRTGVDTFKPKKVKKSVKRFARRIGISKQEAHKFAKTLVSQALTLSLDFNFKSGKKKKK